MMKGQQFVGEKKVSLHSQTQRIKVVNDLTSFYFLPHTSELVPRFFFLFANTV